MFPGAVRILNAGWLPHDVISENELVEAPPVLALGCKLWSIPHELKPADSIIELAPRFSHSDLEELVQYRVLVPWNEELDLNDPSLGEEVPRFVIDIIYPPEYPPEPPIVRIFSNCRVSGQDRELLRSQCIETLQNSHPLFLERVVPMCDLIMDRIRSLRQQSEGDFWSEVFSDKKRQPGVEDAEQQTKTSALEEGVAHSPEAANERTKFHTRELNDLTSGEFDPRTANLTTTAECTSGLGVSLAPAEEAARAVTSRFGRDTHNNNCETRSQSPSVTSNASSRTGTLGASCRSGNGMRSPRRNPIDSYIFAKDRNQEEGPAESQGGARKTPSRRRRARKGTGLRGLVPLPRQILLPTSRLAARPRTDSGRLEADFEEFGFTDGKGHGDSNENIVTINASNKVDRARYTIHIVRVKKIVKEVAVLEGLLVGFQQKVDSCAARLAIDMQSYSRIDHPHLDRVHMVWVETVRGPFLASLSAANTLFATQSTDLNPQEGEGELCVCIQMEYSEHLPLLITADLPKLVQKDELMPARVAQQVFESLAYLHGRHFAYLQDFSKARIQVEDSGVSVKLGVPNLAAFLALSLRGTDATLGPLSSARGLYRVESMTVVDQLEFISRTLKLAPLTQRLLRQHSVMCSSRCRGGRSACSVLLRVDNHLCGAFLLKLLDSLKRASVPLAPEIAGLTPFLDKKLRLPVNAMPTAMELLQEQAITQPLIAKEALKDILYQVSHPESTDAVATVETLFTKPRNVSSVTSFLFQAQESTLWRQWDDQLPYVLASCSEAVRCLTLDRDEATAVEDLLDDFLEADQACHFCAYTETFDLPLVLYKDVYTAQVLSSVIESYSLRQVDLPLIVPFDILKCRGQVGNRVAPTLVNALCASHPGVSRRALTAVQVLDFLGYIPEDNPAMFLTQPNLLVSLPRSLQHTLRSFVANINSIDQTLPLQAAHLALIPVNRPSGVYSHPQMALRALIFQADPPECLRYPAALHSWCACLVNLQAILSPYSGLVTCLRYTVSFPALIESLCKLLDVPKGRQQDVMDSLMFGQDLPAEMEKLKGDRRFSETSMKLARLGSTSPQALVDELSGLQTTYKNDDDMAEWLSTARDRITDLTLFLTRGDICELEGIQIDLFGAAGALVSGEGEKLPEFFCTVHTMLDGYAALLACGGELTDGRSQEGRGYPIYYAELSVDYYCRVVNHLECQKFEELGPRQPLLSHTRSANVLVVMQRWSTCRRALSLACKLQLLGVQCECRARPVVNLQSLRRELPNVSSAVVHIVLIRNHGSGVVFRVDSLVAQSEEDPGWESATLETERDVIAHILGHARRTKTTVRSAVLRDCAKLVKR